MVKVKDKPGKSEKYPDHKALADMIRSFAGSTLSYIAICRKLHIADETLATYRSKSKDVAEACEYAINESHERVVQAIQAKCDMGDTSMLIYTAKTQLARRDPAWKEDRSITVNHEAIEKAEVLETTKALVEELAKKNKRDH